MNILEARRRTLGGRILKKTVTGNPAIAQDSLARMYPGIEMQGWTEQDSTTGAQLFDASGKEVNSSTFIPFPVAVTDGKYTLSTNANRSTAGNAFVFFSGGNVTSGGDGVYEGKSVTVDSVDGYVTILMRKIEGIDPIKNFETMLNAGTTAKPYEPYTGGVPSPSPDYPQEIVNAGSWNEDTQKWEYEITITNAQTDPDKNQSVTLTADRPLTKWDRMEKRNGQWGWVYKSMEITLNGSEGWMVYAAYEGFLAIHILDTPRVRAEGFCESFICETAQYTGKSTALWLGVNNNIVYAIRIPQYNEELPDSGLQDWKDWLSENPITILTYADEETFVPLSESEQEAMNALHTYRPTTVLSNQQDCDMTLTYKSRKGMS